MPASRSARAMTLAPRSWPSRPGLAITTRIFWDIFSWQPAAGGWQQLAAGSSCPLPAARCLLDYRRFFVFPPHMPQRVAHFAYCGIRPHRLDQQRHGVGRSARALLQRVKGRANASIVAALPDPIELGQLTFRGRFVDVERSNRRAVLADEVVEAHDNLVALLTGLLDTL